MAYEIELLTPGLVPGQKFKIVYETSGYYDLVESEAEGGPRFDLIRCEFDHKITKSFDVDLAPDYYENALDYCICENKQVIAILEIAHELWNNRLRITEIWVHENYRLKGIGSMLIDFATDKAVEFGARSLVLETQSCNLPAIDFYLKKGFKIIGFDQTAYTNQDVERHEVRFEMGKKL